MTEFSRLLKLIDIPNGSSSHDIAANASEGESIAHRLGLEAVLALSAQFTVTRPQDGPIIQVDGHLKARVCQLCVVTLEPFESDITETVDAAFTTRGRATDDTEIIVDALGEDAPEPIVDGRIDLGELAVQYLSLALDPFPRRPDVTPLDQAFGVSEASDAGDDDKVPAPDNPFAVLEHWKRRP